MVRHLTIWLMAALLAGAVWAQDAAFVPGVEDLPLMTGLTASADDLVVFDKPEGRIVEARATGRITLAAIAEFYVRTLPQLGWRRDGGLSFSREDEQLDIVIETSGGTSIVLFRIAPR